MNISGTTKMVYANYMDTILNATGRFWTLYNYIGIKVEIPLFDGLLKGRQKRNLSTNS